MSRITYFCALVALTTLFNAVALNAQQSSPNPSGWGECEPTPAVVNPVVVSPLQKVLSLRGKWDFHTDPELGARIQMGMGNLPADFWNDADQIEVPGCWEAQGVGEPAMSETWDCKWDCNPRPLAHVYMGGAIYHKAVDIPNDWEKSRVWLKIGGVRTEAMLWIDNTPVGIVNNYCGSYKFDVTDLLTPGETAEIVAYVRNDTPSRKGQMCDFHKFGGFYRDVELEATPQTWIDDVWVQGQISETGNKDVDQVLPPTRNARVHFTIKTKEENEETRVSVKIKTLNGQTIAEKGVTVNPTIGAEEETIVDVPVNDVSLWTPESPNLYLADVVISNKKENSKHGWTERFGFRKLEVIGKRFYLNGNPYFLRGYGETFIYPITMTSPASHDAHRKNFAVIKSVGFNETRMHTHCEIPEYFEAADEAGVLIQPELPYYSNVPTEGFSSDPLRDIQELYRHYRRYTSFAIYCAGNEGGFGEDMEKKLYEWVKKTDPDRFYQLQDGGWNRPEISDFLTRPITIWSRGDFDDQPYPFVAHEYMNLTIKLDPRLEPLFTGAMPSPVSMEDYENKLKELGLSRKWGDACIHAAGVLQAFWQKEGVESARKDAECDGYSFWNFIDQMVVQDSVYTSQGYMNAFYQVKDGGMTPQEFARFNSPTAIMPEFKSASDIFVSGETVPLEFWIATFEDRPLESGTIEWKLESDEEAPEMFCSGSIPFDRFEIGDVRVAATVDITFPELDRATGVKLTSKIKGANVENVSTVWAFPKREQPSLDGYVVAPEFVPWFEKHYQNVEKYDSKTSDPGKVLIASYDEDSYRQGVKEGRRILAIRPTEGGNNFNLGWWWMGAQLGTAFADSPVFGDFPHKGSMIPSLWFRIIKDDPVPVSSVVGEFEPLALGELLHDYALYVGEKKEGDAKILAVFGLQLFEDVPEALSLLDNFVKYVASDKFQSE